MGKFEIKFLGTKLLEATSKPQEEQKKIYKDVGDSALVLTGFFARSIEEKLVDRNYYKNLGQMAYEKMDSIYPDYFDIPQFYKMMATSFDRLATMLELLSAQSSKDGLEHFLLNVDTKGKAS